MKLRLLFFLFLVPILTASNIYCMAPSDNNSSNSREFRKFLKNSLNTNKLAKLINKLRKNEKLTPQELKEIIEIEGLAKEISEKTDLKEFIAKKFLYRATNQLEKEKESDQEQSLAEIVKTFPHDLIDYLKGMLIGGGSTILLGTLGHGLFHNYIECTELEPTSEFECTDPEFECTNIAPQSFFSNLAVAGLIGYGLYKLYSVKRPESVEDLFMKLIMSHDMFKSSDQEKKQENKQDEKNKN